jgi:addiction module HigA family antidote
MELKKQENPMLIERDSPEWAEAEAKAAQADDRLPPVSPGEMLLEEFLKPLEIKPGTLAAKIGINRIAVSEILSGERAITANTALRLARFFANSPQFWMNLQVNYDLEVEKRKRSDELERIKPFVKAA